MKGMELCEFFYRMHVSRILEAEFPELRCSVGLVGFGSDVLGYDDEVSRDHLWGPRLSLFPETYAPAAAEAIHAALARGLPRTVLGFPVGFGEPDAHGIAALSADEAVFRPMIRIMPFEDFLQDHIGRRDARGMSDADWLACSEQKLLALSKGRLFRDDLGLSAEIAALGYYPRDVWLYLLSSDWFAIAEERAFVKRTAARGDDLGSRVICARIAQRLMHLCFLYERRYAPYSKWFGTAFKELACFPEVEPVLARALGAEGIAEREREIARAQAILIEMHNARGLTPRVEPAIGRYYTRDILVAPSDAVAEALHAQIKNPALSALPPIGALSSVGNLTGLCENAAHFERLKRLYE